MTNVPDPQTLFSLHSSSLTPYILTVSFVFRSSFPHSSSVPFLVLFTTTSLLVRPISSVLSSPLSPFIHSLAPSSSSLPLLPLPHTPTKKTQIGKAAGADKKLYKQIEIKYDPSNSPPDSADGPSSSFRNIISPFGPLDQPASRRTLFYLIGTLNASFPDYDFS